MSADVEFAVAILLASLLLAAVCFAAYRHEGRDEEDR